CGRIDQRVVDFVVTKLVVDALHAVEVDEEQQERFFLSAREVEIRRGLFEKTAAIEESGQIVIQRTVTQRIFEFFTFGNVAYDVDQSAAVDARDRDFKWERAATEFQTHG